MSHHQFTTPRVVYLGQAYRGQDDRPPRTEARVPRASDRSANARLSARPAEAAAQATAR